MRASTHFYSAGLACRVVRLCQPAKVEVRPSGIDDPSSGNGVFVARDTVPAGALVALYAGVWFPSVVR